MKIGHENNNALKTNGYNFEHNSGHGKQHLSILFATMIFSLSWEPAHSIGSMRRGGFEHTRALTLYFRFDDWDHMMRFMFDKLTKPRKNRWTSTETDRLGAISIHVLN